MKTSYLLILLVALSMAGCRTTEDSATTIAADVELGAEINALPAADFCDSVMPMAEQIIKGVVTGNAIFVLPYCSASLKERINDVMMRQTAMSVRQTFGTFQRIEPVADFRQETVRLLMCKAVFEFKRANGTKVLRELPYTLLAGTEDGKLRVFAFSLTPVPM